MAVTEPVPVTKAAVVVVLCAPMVVMGDAEVIPWVFTWSVESTGKPMLPSDGTFWIDPLCTCKMEGVVVGVAVGGASDLRENKAITKPSILNTNRVKALI